MKKITITLIAEENVREESIIGALNHGLKDWDIGEYMCNTKNKLEGVSGMVDTYIVKKLENTTNEQTLSEVDNE